MAKTGLELKDYGAILLRVVAMQVQSAYSSLYQFDALTVTFAVVPSFIYCFYGVVFGKDLT